LSQTFLGNPATFGDDRSLTNEMLRRYRVIYSSEAICRTLVPEHYGQFFRQQLRWKKSWLRECFRAGLFFWRKNPFAAFFFYLSVLFPVVSPLIVANALIVPLTGINQLSLLYVYGVVLTASIYSFCYLAKNRNTMWGHGILFSVLYMTVLVWQTYYALATVRRNHWGTR
jgi:hyaluronan synthase